MSRRFPSLPVGRRYVAPALFAVLASMSWAGPGVAAETIRMEVAWTSERCDFVVTRNPAGHGIVMRLTALSLKEGDVLVGNLDAVGYGRRIEKDGSAESGMMQIRKYGIRRQDALDLVYEWSRYCNPPEE